jgi:hypothetical protein
MSEHSSDARRLITEFVVHYNAELKRREKWAREEVRASSAM